jgi:hypothetical protein
MRCSGGGQLIRGLEVACFEAGLYGSKQLNTGTLGTCQADRGMALGLQIVVSERRRV